MTSFFEKLKKGMGVEGPVEEEVEKKIEKKPKKESKPSQEEKKAKVPRARKPSTRAEPSTRAKHGTGLVPNRVAEGDSGSGLGAGLVPHRPDSEVGAGAGLEIKTEPIKVKVEKIGEPEVKEKKESALSPEAPTEKEVGEERGKWFEREGQLAIDIYQTENDLVIQSAIAGVKPEFLDISLEREIITIRGKREKPFEEKGDYFTRECYWGPFSREVILPVEVDPNRAEATMKEGILTIRLPKIEREKKRKITVKG